MTDFKDDDLELAGHILRAIAPKDAENSLQINRVARMISSGFARYRAKAEPALRVSYALREFIQAEIRNTPFPSGRIGASPRTGTLEAAPEGKLLPGYIDANIDVV